MQTETGHPIAFVPQECLPFGTAYEAYIAHSGKVPTRENLHDFFNALVWLHLPRTKARLNALQAWYIHHRQAEKGARGTLRDAATIFDENAALLVTSDASLVDDLRRHAWTDAFLKRRSTFGTEWSVLLFGHALMEKLVTPFKAITAHAWPILVEDSFFGEESASQIARIDRAAASMLNESLTTRHFLPLPVAGLPGWWPAQDASFYEDDLVFRPQRIKP
ncbi:DUF3025 domain-containing protein [Noviherbaspirillum sp. 17J57-3]|uniref:DUF3025 domain-containing protein n=1 Tax=Noviherbaspirillum galbum TaxID=2709383 RepID=A0A6B3SU78_9BURK|nr:DUF3025 domain-containing protein [Noviherbaspirillum galbum]